MMEFFSAEYGKTYKPNTRETVRRQTVHQFVDAGLLLSAGAVNYCAVDRGEG